MARSLPRCVDTVIIGNGPSALILSYILHGHVPYYIGGHHDVILDQKLRKTQNESLLHLTPDLYAHFLSSLSYSTAALPVNTLLDTLIRPNADTEINPTSCVEWRFEPEKAISHVAIGDTARAGGQWAEDTVSASNDIGTLSYAEQLSLPGYSYAEHLAKKGKADQCDFVRPTRTEVAEYLAAYPPAVGISDSIFTSLKVDDIHRTDKGFEIGSLNIRCKHLVLASGIFTVNIPPPPLLTPAAHVSDPSKPLLVIGSGFSAADVIISAPLDRKIIHIYKWSPETRPSPLRGCHQSAYPEYATIYRQMKLSALSSLKTRQGAARTPLARRKSNPFFTKRDWNNLYQGLPNATITSVSSSPTSPDTVHITIRLSTGEEVTHEIGSLAYVVGRRGNLDFLSPPLRAEIITSSSDPPTPFLISAHTLRTKAETSLEITKNIFIIGSLAGDSLIRHAIGGCVFAAGRIMHAIPLEYSPFSTPPGSPRSTISASLEGEGEFNERGGSEESIGNSTAATTTTTTSNTSEDGQHENTLPNGSAGAAATHGGHEDLHVDRRKMVRAVEAVSAENEVWKRSGWWAGGLGPSSPAAPTSTNTNGRNGNGNGFAK